MTLWPFFSASHCFTIPGALTFQALLWASFCHGDTVLRLWVKVCVPWATKPRRWSELSVQHQLLLLWWWVISASSAAGFLLGWLQAIMLFAPMMFLIGFPPLPWQRQHQDHVSFGPARCCSLTDGLVGHLDNKKLNLGQLWSKQENCEHFFFFFLL